MLDHETFEPRGRWELDRGPQHLAYDFWWHLGHDVMITSEWGTPNMVNGGADPELLLAGKYGNALHVWDLQRRSHLQKLELGAEQQMVLELRPAHDPRRSYGFVGVVVSLKDLSSSIWMWHHNDETGRWETRKVIEIPAEPADPSELPPFLQGFKAVPPLVTDINLSLDDRFLYVSCWGTGELRQYDVSDPFAPKLIGTLQIGGIVRRKRPPQESRSRAERRAADGRGQPRRPAGLSDERALHVVGRAVLSRRHSRLDGEDRRRTQRGHGVRSAISRRVRGWIAAASGTTAGRRRVVRLVLLRGVTMHAASLPWLSLFILGAVHGINPAMGWLFAVARGLQQRDRRALWRALGPLALGHARRSPLL